MRLQLPLLGQAGSLEALPPPFSHPCRRNHTFYLEISHFSFFLYVAVQFNRI